MRNDVFAQQAQPLNDAARKTRLVDMLPQKQRAIIGGRVPVPVVRGQEVPERPQEILKAAPEEKQSIEPKKFWFEDEKLPVAVRMYIQSLMDDEHFQFSPVDPKFNKGRGVGRFDCFVRLMKRGWAHKGGFDLEKVFPFDGVTLLIRSQEEVLYQVSFAKPHPHRVRH